MSISSLSSQYISASFAGLMQYSSSNNIYDGNGNQITTLNISASYALNGAGGTAGGSAGSVQYAGPGGTFAGDAAFIYNGSLQSLEVGALNNQATGQYSVAMNKDSQAVGIASTALGYLCAANGVSSLATGESTIANGSGSAAFGNNTIASGSYQTVVGRYNSKGDDTSLFIVGNGDGDTPSRRRDAFKVTESGSIVVKPLYSTLYPPSPPSHTGVPGELMVTWDGSNVFIYAWHPATNAWQKTTLS